MKISTLKDVKDALQEIPDVVLDMFGVGPNEDGELTLLCWANDEGEAMKQYEVCAEKYPQINDIAKWVENIILVAGTMDEGVIEDLMDGSEPVSNETKVI